jgi:malyl-CoA/(S)-citramalyl-CoA lyase
MVVLRRGGSVGTGGRPAGHDHDPGVGCAADVHAVDAPLTAVERAKARSKPVGFEVIIESAAGIALVKEIAAFSPGLQPMSLGAADFAASMGMQTTGIGGTQVNHEMLQDGTRHWSDPRHWAQAAIVPVGHAGDGGQMGHSFQAGGAGQRGFHPVGGGGDRGARRGGYGSQGRLVDIALIKQAKVVVRQAEMNGTNCRNIG